MKEFEPRTEIKIPLCGGCGKPVDITNLGKGYLKSGDDYFHLNHFRTKEYMTWKHQKEIYNLRKEEIKKLNSIDKGAKIT